MPVIRSYAQAAWTAGTSGSPATIEGFDVWDVGLNVEQVESIGNRVDTNNGMTLPPYSGEAFNRVGFSTYILGQEGSAVPMVIGSLLRSGCAAEAEAGSTYSSYSYTWPARSTTALIPLASSGSFDPLDIHIVTGADATSTGQTIIADNVAAEEIDFVFAPGDMAYMRYAGRGTVDTSETTSTTSGYNDTARTTRAAGLPDPVTPHNFNFQLTPQGTSAFTPIMKSVTFQVRIAVAPRRDLNNAHGLTTPQPTGYSLSAVVKIETPGISSYLPMTQAKARTRQTIGCRFNNGGGAGQQIEFAMDGFIDPATVARSTEDGIEVTEFVVNADDDSSGLSLTPESTA